MTINVQFQDKIYTENYIIEYSQLTEHVKLRASQVVY